MGQQFPLALQVALYAASGAIVVLGAVLIHMLLRFGRQLDRVVTAVERFEAELTPLARESRAAVDELRDLSGRTLRGVEVAGGLFLAPVLALNRTAQLVRVGATTFLRSLWTGRRPSQSKARTS
jgi:hypothetical protein